MNYDGVTPVVEQRDDIPVIVSFYGGDEYYHRAAERLREDCDGLGLRHHIEERDVSGLEWPEICREPR